MYTIGQVSELVGLPVSTLRYYDQQGLFPDLERSSGIRRFGDRELETLRIIECLKRSGLEIRDIRQYIDWCKQGSDTYEQRRELFVRQKANVEAEIAHLNRVLDMLKFKCWFYDQAIRDGSDAPVRAMLPDHLPEEIQKAYDNAHSI